VATLLGIVVSYYNNLLIELFGKGINPSISRLPLLFFSTQICFLSGRSGCLGLIMKNPSKSQSGFFEDLNLGL